MEFSSGIYNLNLYPEPIRLGRNVDCEIVLKDFAVSRIHATISKKDNSYVLTDNSSQSGTFINNTNVTHHTLTSGDEIGIGTHILKYQSSGLQHSLYLSKTENRVASATIGPGDTLYFGRSSSNDLHYPIHSLPLVFLKCTLQDTSLLLRPLNQSLVNPAGKRKRQFTLLNGEVAHFKHFSIEFSDGDVSLYRNTLGASLYTRKLYWHHDNFELSDISLTVNPGECVAILGMSGDGKSTLLNCISGSLRPHSGAISIDGRGYFSNSASYLEQKAPIYSYLTVFESLFYAAELVLPKDLTTKERKNKVYELLDLFDLITVKDLLSSRMSGGQQKRLALAIELISGPNLLLLDEPTSGLDPLNDSLLTDYLAGITDSGHTIVLTTHNYTDLHKFDRIVLLQKGQLIFQGSPSQALDFFNVEEFHKILDKIKLYNADENRDKLKESQLILQESADSKHTTPHKWNFSTSTKNPFIPVTQRLTRQFTRDTGRITLTFIQPFILGMLLLLIFDEQSSHWTMAFTLVICSLWYSLSNSIREIVQEKEMLKKELQKGLSIIPYILAKTVPLSCISFLQAVITFAILKYYYHFNWDIILSSVTLGVIAIAGTSLGLLFSTIARTENQSLTFLPLLLIPQVLFAGALIEVDLYSYPGYLISHGIFSKWSYNILKSVFVEAPMNGALFIPIIAIIVACIIIQTLMINRIKKRTH